MLVITTIKKAELLLPVCGVVGGIDIQQDLPSFPDLFPADPYKPISKASCILRSSRGEGEFSQRLRVGCEPSGSPRG